MAIHITQAINASQFHDANHNVWRRNGQTKTWKRRPEAFRIPVKYGMYDYGYITNMSDAHIPDESCPPKKRR